MDNKEYLESISNYYFIGEDEKDIIISDNMNEEVFLYDLVELLKKNKMTLQFMGCNIITWIQHFKNCINKPENFFEQDIGFIEKKYAEWQLLKKFFSKKEWKELYDAINEMEKLLIISYRTRQQLKAAEIIFADKNLPPC
jgi:hypothetical protein